MNNKDRKNRFSLTILFSVFVFAILFVSVMLTIFIALAASWMELIALNLQATPQIRLMLFPMSIISLVIGFGVAVIAGRYSLKPINRMITQMNRLANGDFNARLEFNKFLAPHPIFKEISESFNKMAEELEGTEMLRSDFINNFSHEFKTPIVSIAGFTKLLKRGNLTEEQKTEYINIIEEESMRLAAMANNVLNLTKVENQTILTDVSTFNLSEQLRSSVLLLESKWVKKNTEFSLEFGEFLIMANEELLKQVWINLIDNAVKFSPEFGFVEIKVFESDGTISVSIANSGSTILPENQKRIFNKFYQVDESHGGEGNGIGLAIVKRIVDLHGGKITVKSKCDITTFTVELPKNR